MSDCQICGLPPFECRCSLTEHRDYGITTVKSWGYSVSMLRSMSESKVMAEPRYKRLQALRGIFLKPDA